MQRSAHRLASSRQACIELYRGANSPRLQRVCQALHATAQLTRLLACAASYPASEQMSPAVIANIRILPPAMVMTALPFVLNN